jgi:hypothetical protein
MNTRFWSMPRKSLTGATIQTLGRNVGIPENADYKGPTKIHPFYALDWPAEIGVKIDITVDSYNLIGAVCIDVKDHFLIGTLYTIHCEDFTRTKENTWS